jgi:hypothetical protein
MKDVPLENIANGLKVRPFIKRQEGQSVPRATQTATLADAGTRAILRLPMYQMEAKQ